MWKNIKKISGEEMKKQLPKNAKKVFSGIIFDVYQWQQKMFDGSTETFEMTKRVGSVDIIATIGKKIIVLEQQQPGRNWHPALPGGRIEKGDLALNTVKRELLEETGCIAKKMVFMAEFFGYSKMHFHERVYIARDCQKIAKQSLDSGEKIKVKLVSFDEFLELVQNRDFAVPIDLKFIMYNAMLSKKKKEELRIKIFGDEK